MFFLNPNIHLGVAKTSKMLGCIRHAQCKHKQQHLQQFQVTRETKENERNIRFPANGTLQQSEFLILKMTTWRGERRRKRRKKLH